MKWYISLIRDMYMENTIHIIKNTTVKGVLAENGFFKM